MGKVRKLGKKIWKGIKKVGKKIAKGFKKVFKGVGKFLHKLGPIGTIGMMIAMPYIGAYLWQGFGTWAGSLSGTFGKVMQGVYNAGNSIAGAYKSVTDAVYGTLKKIPGVGDALEGFDRFVDKARQWVGLEPGAAPVMNDKELTTWMNSDEGLKVMGFDSTEAFRQANPSFFKTDGGFTAEALNFGRGHSVAFEAHLRGKDIYKSVNGEYDFSSYSDNFNSTLNKNYNGSISNFGNQFEGINSVNLRSGTPQTTQGYNKALSEATKDLTPEQLIDFDTEAFRTEYMKTAPTSFDAPTGLFGEKTGSMSLEGIPSRYRHVAFDANNQPYIKQGTKLGAATRGPLLGATTTAVQGAITGQPEYTLQEGYVAGRPYVADMPSLEPSLVASTGPVSAGNFPQTMVSLNYAGLLNVQDPSTFNMNNYMNGGVYMPQTNLPNITDYLRLS